MMTDQTRIRRSPRATGHALSEGEGGVLLHLESGQYHGLNSVAWVIWNLLDEPRDISSLIDGVQARFPDAAEQAGDDVRALMASLLERDLIEVIT